ncbi:MAG TPA: metallophosphoesterase [Steroidobacteraceae bacterium]|nr:metallophosphoesterase [Steroidobacteraceae bacterium]
MLLAADAAATLPDGPYVLRSAAGGWEAVSVEVTAAGARPRSRLVKEGESLMVAAVGQAPAFAVKLRAPAPDSGSSVDTKDAPVFVVADTHGEYEIFVGMLRDHQIVDARLRWKFGRGHLVVLGDVFDRGPNHLEILWLLYELEAEAARAGGGVHLVLGNHEVMALSGDLRYLNTHYSETAQVLGKASYSELFARDSMLGQWLRSKPAMLVVNDSLCLHAGVSRALLDSGLTIADINATVRSTLNGEPGQGAIGELVMGTNGPLWYRGYFAEQSAFLTATAEDVELTLKTFGARRILIGHTIVPTITPMYGGKVIAVQVYPKREPGGTAFESLLIRKGKLLRAQPGGAELPLAR